MKLQYLKRDCVVCTILLLQSFVFCAMAAIDDDATWLRRVNISESTINQCPLKCVTSVETGHQSGCLGYAGDDCSFPYEICPDSVTQCFGPMAVCVDVGGNADERAYTCECRAPDTNEPYAELTQESRIEDCRNRVTEVCEKGQTASSYAFCTNGGLCVEEVEEGEPHPGCFCPGRFVGKHCEKRRGTGTEYDYDEPSLQVGEVNEIPNQTGKIGNRQIGTSMSVVVVLLSSALSAFLIYAAVAYKRFLAQRDENPLEDENIGKVMDVPPGGDNDCDVVLEVH